MLQGSSERILKHPRQEVQVVCLSESDDTPKVFYVFLTNECNYIETHFYSMILPESAAHLGMQGQTI